MSISLPEKYLMDLMLRKPIPWNIGRKRVELGEEQLLSISCADFLRQQTLLGNVDAVWCHVPNEGKRNWLTALVLKAMGMIPGALDFWFIKKTGGLLIELKTNSNTTTDSQDNFIVWSSKVGVPTEIVFSFEQFKGALIRNGIWNGGVHG